VIQKQLQDAKAGVDGTPDEMLSGLLSSGDTWTIL
jgi:2-oxoglutarate ferredoxin oxidoreductase subunit beta